MSKYISDDDMDKFIKHAMNKVIAELDNELFKDTEYLAEVFEIDIFIQCIAKIIVGIMEERDNG